MITYNCIECSSLYEGFTLKAARCRDCVKAYMAARAKEDRLRDPYTYRWRSIKSRAKKRGLDFDLTVKQVQLLLAARCHYCGDTGALEIDRKVPVDGYTWMNVVPACRPCNMIKGPHLTHDEMVEVASLLRKMRS